MINYTKFEDLDIEFHELSGDAQFEKANEIEKELKHALANVRRFFDSYPQDLREINLKGTALNNEVWYNNTLLSPIASQAVHNHSPDGFSWGYSGSGPAQLALAILLQCCDDYNLNYQVAISNYQRFKELIIASLDINGDFDFNINLEGYLK